MLLSASRGIANCVSPRHLRSQHHLANLTLDPGTIPQPLGEPRPRNFAICGSPRTGTALLHQPPSVVTAVEQLEAMRLPPAELFRSLREEIAGGELRHGRPDVSSKREKLRVDWCRENRPSICAYCATIETLGHDTPKTVESSP